MTAPLNRREALALGATLAGGVILVALPGCGGGGAAPSTATSTPSQAGSSRQFVSAGISALNKESMQLDEARLSSNRVAWLAVTGEKGALEPVPAWRARLAMLAEGYVAADGSQVARLLLRPMVVGAVSQVSAAAGAAGRLAVEGHELELPAGSSAADRNKGLVLVGLADVWQLREGDRVAVYGCLGDSGKLQPWCVELLNWRGSTLRMGTTAAVSDRNALQPVLARLGLGSGGSSAAAIVNAARARLVSGEFSDTAGAASDVLRSILAGPELTAVYDTQAAGLSAAKVDGLAAAAVMGIPFVQGQELVLTGVAVPADPVAPSTAVVRVRGLEIVPGPIGMPAVGDRVQVTGVVKDNRLVISKAVTRPAAASVTLRGMVSQFMGERGFAVRGHLVDARQAGVTGGALEHLGNGAAVTVTATARGQALVASHIRFEQDGAAGPVILSGPFTHVDMVTQTLRMSGRTVMWDASTQWPTLSALGLGNARYLRVKGRADSYGIITAEVIVAAMSLTAVVCGTIDDVSASAVVVNGQTYTLSSNTVLEPSDGAAGAAPQRGMSAIVLVQPRPQAMDGSAPPNTDSGYASWLMFGADEHRRDAWACVAHDVASAGQWRLGGQLMDASKADVVRGDIRDLVDGARVAVQGALEVREGTPVYVVRKLRIFESWSV